MVIILDEGDDNVLMLHVMYVNSPMLRTWLLVGV